MVCIYSYDFMTVWLYCYELLMMVGIWLLL